MLILAWTLNSCAAKKVSDFPKKYIFEQDICEGDSIYWITLTAYREEYKICTLENSYLVFDDDSTGYIGKDSVNFLYFKYKKVDDICIRVERIQEKSKNAEFYKDTLFTINGEIIYATFLLNGERKQIRFIKQL